MTRRGEPDLAVMVRRQQVLADFGEFALRSQKLDEILAEACRLVAEALGIERAKILEVVSGGGELLVRAGVGWKADIVGKVLISMTECSSESFSIRAGKPVITQDISKEDRFDVPQFMKDAGVVALVNVPIFLPGGQPYGLLEVDATEPRAFGEDKIQFLRTYASILGPVIDRLLVVRTLRSSEERFRLTVEAALDYAIFLTDSQGRITDWLPGAQAVFGWTAEEMIGQPFAKTFTPEDREAQQDQEELETARTEGVAPDIRWHLHKGGRRVFIDGSTRALRDSEGTLIGFIKVGQDVTERRKAEERLRASEERLRHFGEASSDLIWICRSDTLEFDYVGLASAVIYGEAREAMSGRHGMERWLDLICPEDRERALAGLQRVRDGERVSDAFRILRPSDGETRWIENTNFPLRDEAGHVRHVAGITKDVTDARRNAARLEVLVAELQHRSRNLLGVIASVAAKTLGEDGAAASFQARLQALSRAQGLLSQFGSDVAEVGALIHAELEAHTQVAPPRVIISGPKVHLTARQVQNFSMAVHELTTNAVKYGALQNGVGALAVTWQIIRDEKDRRCLALEWKESGLAITPDQPVRRGYGRHLIEKALSYALKPRPSSCLRRTGCGAAFAFRWNDPAWRADRRHGRCHPLSPEAVALCLKPRILWPGAAFSWWRTSS